MEAQVGSTRIELVRADITAQAVAAELHVWSAAIGTLSPT